MVISEPRSEKIDEIVGVLEEQLVPWVGRPEIPDDEVAETCKEVRRSFEYRTAYFRKTNSDLSKLEDRVVAMFSRLSLNRAISLDDRVLSQHPERRITARA